MDHNKLKNYEEKVFNPQRFSSEVLSISYFG